MLRVTIELVPFGDDEKKTTISTLYIGNIGAPAAQINHPGTWRRYQVSLFDPRNDVNKEQAAQVRYYHHKREDGAEVCVAKAIQALKGLI
jgi:hypothetical protein